MLYELRPDVCPQGFLTEVERQLWELYLTDLNEHRAHG
jgi:hypothetical protein